MNFEVTTGSCSGTEVTCGGRGKGKGEREQPSAVSHQYAGRASQIVRRSCMRMFPPCESIRSLRQTSVPREIASRWRTQGPGSKRDDGHHREVYQCADVYESRRQVGCDGTCEVEDCSGVRPFLQSWKPWNDQRDRTEKLPNSQDGEKVLRVAEPIHSNAHMRNPEHVPDTSQDELEFEQSSSCPIGNVPTCFGGHGESRAPKFIAGTMPKVPFLCVADQDDRPNLWPSL